MFMFLFSVGMLSVIAGSLVFFSWVMWVNWKEYQDDMERFGFSRYPVRFGDWLWALAYCVVALLVSCVFLNYMISYLSMMLF